ncbi:hypothetical protein BLA29_008181, partial [Euroglyphus maynei]
MLSIDGRMDSLELLDLITAPGGCNRHRRVLSIGKTIDDDRMDEQSTTNETESSSIPMEKALIFSLSRQMNVNILRLNIEMASFCYVHSSILVYELSLCRKCFIDVLEAYFSRSFKERVRAATTEVLRGIVPDANSDTTPIAEQQSTNDLPSTTTPPPMRPTSSSSKLSLFNNKKSTMNQPRKTKFKTKTQQRQSMVNPFVDNFKLNIFIRSPVIICPISPSSHEVVVFHLGHMLLNNHNHSTDIIRTTSG